MKYSQKGFVEIVLIILGVLLSLFAIGFFREDQTTNRYVPNYQTTANLDCGLTVYTPETNRVVSNPLLLDGFVNGCGWDEVHGSLGTVRVVSDTGVVLVMSKLQRTDTDGKLPYHFNTKLSLPIGRLTRKGSVIISNDLPGPQLRTKVIPVSFW
jgi:hypothetical protein